MRKTYGCALGLLCYVLCANAATSDIHAFEYQPELINAGTLYHYVKSNHDGTNPAQVWVYISTRDHLEVLKWEEDASDFAFVTAEMDWNMFSPSHLAAWNLTNLGLFRPQAEGNLDPETNQFTTWVPGGDGGTSTISHYPAHVYNFDLISFNYIFRHLKNPEDSFEIGVVDPTWKGGLGHLQYKGTISIEYQKQENHNGVDCRVYRIGGPGLNDQFGLLWVDLREGHFVDLVHPLPDNPNWDNFKIELRSTDHLTLQQWHGFIDSKRKAMNERAKEQTEIPSSERK